jgi:hypothetical protein
MSQQVEAGAIRRFYTRKVSFDAGFNARARRKGDVGVLPFIASPSTLASQETEEHPTSGRASQRKPMLPIGVDCGVPQIPVTPREAHCSAPPPRTSSLKRGYRTTMFAAGELALHRRNRIPYARLHPPQCKSAKAFIVRYEVFYSGEKALRRRSRIPRTRVHVAEHSPSYSYSESYPARLSPHRNLKELRVRVHHPEMDAAVFTSRFSVDGSTPGLNSQRLYRHDYHHHHHQQQRHCEPNSVSEATAPDSFARRTTHARCKWLSIPFTGARRWITRIRFRTARYRHRKLSSSISEAISLSQDDSKIGHCL